MKLSIEWIRDYVALPSDLAPREIVHDLTMATVEVEDALDPSAGLEHIVVGRVIELAELGDGGGSLVQFDIGGDAPLSLVSTGSGFHPGLDTIVALPGARLKTRGGNVTVAPREIMGHESAGMVCRACDVGLEDVLPWESADTAIDLGSFGSAPGTALADLVGWRDIVLDIDNKSLTNRPDLWCHWGIARELAAIYGLPLKDPLLVTPDCPKVPLIGLVDPDLCDHFSALRIVGCENGPSPMWLRSRLARLGHRPIDIIVDLTNYVMLDVGQPTHAYDAAMLTLPLGVRRAADGESLMLLDGSVHSLTAKHTVITDADTPVAAAGVMGGSSSMVSARTKSIILEAATFNALATRHSAGAFALRTDASARNEKALDVQRIEVATKRFAMLLAKCMPDATITGQDQLENAHTERSRVTVSLDFLESRLGKKIAVEEIIQRLSAIGFDIEQCGAELEVLAPSWRSTGDISIDSDILEEVARLHGYENFVPTSPTIEINAPRISRRRDLERNIVEAMASFGLQEVVLYPWVVERYLDAAGYHGADAVQLTDPPSPEQTALQPSLVPGLLECVEANLRYSSSFSIFSSDIVYSTERSEMTEGGELLPCQRREIAAAYVGDDLQSLMRQARGMLDAVFRRAHLQPITMTRIDGAPWAASGAQFALQCEAGSVGVLGVISQRARRKAGLKRAEVVVFTLALDKLNAYVTRENHYLPPLVYQQTNKDISLVFPITVNWENILSTLDGAEPLVRSIAFVDLYTGKGIPDGHRSITLRLTLGAEDRTLDGAEIESTTMRIAKRLETELAGSLRA